MSSTKSAASSKSVVGRSSASSERGFARLQTLLRHIGLPQRAQTSSLYNIQHKYNSRKNDEYLGTLENLAETELFDKQDTNYSADQQNSIVFNHMLCVEGVNNKHKKRKGVHSTGAMQLVTFDNPQLQFSLLCRCSKSDLIRSLKDYSNQTKSFNNSTNNSGMIFHFSGIVTRQLRKDNSQSKSTVSTSPSLFRFMSSNLLDMFSSSFRSNADKSRALPLNPLLFDMSNHQPSEENGNITSNEPLLWVQDSKQIQNSSSSTKNGSESSEFLNPSDVVSVRDVHSLLSSDTQFPVLYMFTLTEDLEDTKQLPPAANIARDILSVCTQDFKSVKHFVLLEIVPTDMRLKEQTDEQLNIPTLSECVRDPVDSYFQWKYGHEFDIGGHYYLPNSPRSQIHNLMRSYIQHIIQTEADSEAITLLERIGHQAVREMFYWHLLCSYMNSHSPVPSSSTYNDQKTKKHLLNNLEQHQDLPTVSLPKPFINSSSEDTDILPHRQLISYPDFSSCSQTVLWHEMERKIHRTYVQLKEERQMAFKSMVNVSSNL